MKYISINKHDNLKKAFFYYEGLDKRLLDNASEVSKGIAKGYDSTAYLTSFNKMAVRYKNNKFI